MAYKHTTNIDSFFTSCKAVYGLSDEALSILSEHTEVVQYKKGETFLHEGEQNLYVYFVSEGLVRYWFLRDGRERILNFSFEGELAIMSVNASRISTVSATAIEDTVLVRFRQTNLEQLFSQSADLAFWGYQVLKQLIDIMDYGYLNLFWMEKKEQYALLLHNHPDILQRIPLKDVASYLNITQSSLSRIRAGVK